MRFIRKKNLWEGEEILYTPELHWIYTIKPLLYSLPFFLLLLILWVMDNSVVAASAEGLIPAQEGIAALSFRDLIRQVFLAGVLVVLVVFIARILQYLNTEYGVTNKRLIMKKGVLRLTVTEIPTDRIESIYCTQGILGRIFHYGTMRIGGIGGSMPVFFMVARPYGLRRKIVGIIEKNKAITVVHGELPRAAPAIKQIVEEEPFYRYGSFVRVLPDGDIY